MRSRPVLDCDHAFIQAPDARAPGWTNSVFATLPARGRMPPGGDRDADHNSVRPGRGRAPVRDPGVEGEEPARRLPAYRELAAAGIMETVPGSEEEYRFTREGLEHGAAILEREAERIERERYEPPDASDLSEAARELLRTCIAGGCPEGDAANRRAYRELVAARIMMPLGSFSKADECVFRFTYWGHRLRFELAGMDGPSPPGGWPSGATASNGSRPIVPATPSPSPARSPSPGW